MTEKATIDRTLDIYVDHKLKKWGRWYLTILLDGLGYPKKSIEGKLLDGGGLLIKSTAPYHIPEDEDCEEIEEILSEMASYKKELAFAIRVKYTSSNLKKTLIAHKMPYPTFNKHFGEAKAWIASRFSPRIIQIKH